MSDPILSPINEFEGINPIVNGTLQTIPKAWVEFHRFHINDMQRHLAQVLRGTGYEARLASSLQVFDPTDWGYRPMPRRTEPDVSIRRVHERHSFPTEAGYSTPRLTLTVAEALNIDPTAYPAAIAVRRLEDIDDPFGKAVVWIELLSPDNKPGGGHHRSYEDKRIDAIAHGQVLVEIDYLHRLRPIIDALSVYKPDRDGRVSGDARPFYISVIDPHHDSEKADIYEFGPEEKIPMLPIPLDSQRIIPFNLDVAYDRTIKECYGRDVKDASVDDYVDYAQLPVDITTFSQDDQNRIAARLDTIEKAHFEGTLDNSSRTEPLPLSAPIDNAMQRWQAKHLPPGGAADHGSPSLDR
ncbi:MAG: DUF4058 family protein [Aggregatilineales bacterium]